MRNLHIYLSALATLYGSGVQAGHRSSHFRDLQACPKFEIQFLNQLPISESDAKRCLEAGVQVEDEWMALRAPRVGQQRLGDGGDILPIDNRLDLMRMALAPPGADLASPYLCLMPHANATASQVLPAEETEVAIDPVSSWAALSHLDGKCLYTRQGWFTYSYCHNQHIRQFRAAPHAHPHPPGGYIPTEDPKQDAYTLGRVKPQETRRREGITDGQARQAGSGGGRQQQSGAAPAPVAAGGSDHTNIENIDSDAISQAKAPAQPPHASSITSSTLGSPSRYLVQRWSDGTLCDKTGRPRETEIQIHCDSSTTDYIYQIKELGVCSYLVIIHSPHLCALPGFKAPSMDVQPAAVRCRRVMDDDEFEEWVKEKKDEEERWYAQNNKEETQKQIEGVPQGVGSGVWPDLRPEGMAKVHVPLIAPPAPPAEDDHGHGQGLGQGHAATLTLKDLLRQALERQAQGLPHMGQAGQGQSRGPTPLGKKEDDDVVEEIMFVTLEQDEDGETAFYVNSDSQGANGQEGGDLASIPDEERELLLKAVKDFLKASEEKKGKKKRGSREGEDQSGWLRDEL